MATDLLAQDTPPPQHPGFPARPTPLTIPNPAAKPAPVDLLTPVRDFEDYTLRNYQAGKAAATAPPFKRDSTAGTDLLQHIGDIGSRALGAAEMATAPMGGIVHAGISKPVERITGVPSDYTDLLAMFTPAGAGAAAGVVGRVSKMIPGAEKALSAAGTLLKDNPISKAVQETFSPTTMSKEAGQAEGIVREQRGLAERSTEQAKTKLDSDYEYLSKLPSGLPTPAAAASPLEARMAELEKQHDALPAADPQRAAIKQQMDALANQRVAQLKTNPAGAVPPLPPKPPVTQLDFIDRIENYSKTKPLADPRAEKAAQNIRGIYHTVRNDLETDPSFDKMGFVQDYFPHMWQDPKKAQQFIQGWARKAGSGKATQKRSIPTIEDGIKAGLVPRSTNPAEITLQYIGNMYNYKALKGMQRTMSDQGLRKFSARGRQPPGWVELKGPGNRALYTDKNGVPHENLAYAPEDAARVYNRYYSPGWTGNTGAAARTLRGIVNGGTQMILGLSGYHYRLLANEDTASAFAKGLSRAEAGKPREALKAAAEGTPYFGAGYHIAKGKAVEDQYITGQGKLDQKIIDYITRAGGRVKGIDKTMTASQSGNYWKAWKEGTARAAFTADMKNLKAGGPIKAIGKVMDTVAYPLFVKTIPRIKNAVNYEGIADWVKAHPQASDEEILKASRDIIDSTDNRFGEMIQDNIFWDKKFKESVQLMLLSTGWALGTGREFVGGAKDLAKSLSEGKELSPRARYIIAAPIANMLHASVYQYLKTGTLPSQPQDFVHPKTGGVSPYNGAPERSDVPGNLKDVIGYQKDFGGELSGKLAPVWRTVMEMAQNQDWRGDPIYSQDIANAPGPLKAYASYLLGAFTPIGVKGAMEGPMKGSNIGRVERLLAGSRPDSMQKENPKAYEDMMKKKRIEGEKAKIRHDAIDADRHKQ